jgi:hypothetical protein
MYSKENAELLVGTFLSFSQSRKKNGKWLIVNFQKSSVQIPYMDQSIGRGELLSAFYKTVWEIQKALGLCD